jgi:hypothetical protein
MPCVIWFHLVAANRATARIGPVDHLIDLATQDLELRHKLPAHVAHRNLTYSESPTSRLIDHAFINVKPAHLPMPCLQPLQRRGAPSAIATAGGHIRTAL